MLNNKDLTPKDYAEYLVDEFYKIISMDMPKNPPKEQMISHFLYPEYIEQAKKCALFHIRQMYEFGSLNGIREPLMFLNATEKELNKILKQL